jgi:hypothetical protein
MLVIVILAYEIQQNLKALKKVSSENCVSSPVQLATLASTKDSPLQEELWGPLMGGAGI